MILIHRASLQKVPSFRQVPSIFLPGSGLFRPLELLFLRPLKVRTILPPTLPSVQEQYPQKRERSIVFPFLPLCFGTFTFFPPPTSLYAPEIRRFYASASCVSVSGGYPRPRPSPRGQPFPIIDRPPSRRGTKIRPPRDFFFEGLSPPTSTASPFFAENYSPICLQFPLPD